MLGAPEEIQTQQSPERAQLEVPDEGQTQQTGSELVGSEPLFSTQEELVPATSVDTDVQPERIPDIDFMAEPAANALQPTEDASQTTRTLLTRPIPAEIHPEIAPTAEPQNAVPENTPATQTTPESTEERMWNAVNTTVTQEEGPTATSRPRKPTGRRKRKAVTLRNMDEEEEEEARRQEGGEVEDDYVPPRSKRPSAKARGKRKVADASVGEEDGTAQPPPKRKRQSRKAKARDPTSAQPGQDEAPGVETGNGVVTENVRDVENGQSAELGENSREATRPTPSRKRKRQSTSQPNGEGEQQPKRRGRPARASTPPEAETVKIDEDIFFMDDLARRNTRIGKLSQREKKMRGIDWEEVKQRQKEKEAEQMNSRAVHAAMERQAQEKEDAVRTAQEQVRYENVDGEMRIVQGSGQVDYQQIADNVIDELVVEEDDFTNRITSRSFMRNNKRYPEEFLLPGQGKRWDIRSTQDFYDALRMFGTDFGMMTTLFEGVSRRSLKLKFTREERKQPDVIKEILQQKDTRLGNWDDYLKASGKDNEQYDRVDQIKQELEAAEEDAKRQIEEAKAEYEEERRQKRLAGFMSDEEGGENEAEAGKKKKGKKGKEKQVTFQDEDVEVLEVDENDGWGAE
jgi:transcription factor TFIIIB component B''